MGCHFRECALSFVNMNANLKTLASPEGWHPELIKAAIRQSGITCEALSVRHGLHKSAVGRALLSPWPRVEAIIAAYLGQRPQDIWPHRYDDSGAPRRIRTRRKNHSRAPLSAHDQKREAA